MVTQFITSTGVFIASLMALGALFGALNTISSAVAGRTREISTLRALGFGTGLVVFSVMVEPVLRAIFGGQIPAIRAARLSIATGLRES